MLQCKTGLHNLFEVVTGDSISEDGVQGQVKWKSRNFTDFFSALFIFTLFVT